MKRRGQSHGRPNQAIRKPALPPPLPAPDAAPALVKIEKPIYGGAFLSRVEGKALFVQLTLPDEQVRVRIALDKRAYSTAEAEEIVVASPQRIAPGCPHFGACGGCNYQHTGYQNQLAFKQAILRETLERGRVQAPDQMAVLAAQPWDYRNRIRVAFDASGNFGYRGRRSHAVLPIRECPIAAPLLVRAALAFAEIARPRRADGFKPAELALFCDAEETSLLATVFVDTSANMRFDSLAQSLREQIPTLVGAGLVLETPAANSHQTSPTLAKWGTNSIAYRAAGFDYRVDQGAFFQVNRWLLDALVERVTAGLNGRLAWDLFAGVGLFARRLTASFERVVAVESAPAAEKALHTNLAGTSGEAVSGDTLAFLRRRHLEKPDLILVDPPRTGLGPEITALLGSIGAPELVYVSCDPATLARDLRGLVASGYWVESVTLADLFPQTFHLETIVRLRRG
jgi:23S rRNA (uracil1939-C5)-methyltransferase